MTDTAIAGRLAGRGIVNYRRLAGHALGAGAITFLLASTIVGVETVSSVAKLGINWRFGDVVIASLGVVYFFFLWGLLRAGRTLPVLIGCIAVLGAFAAIEWGRISGYAFGNWMPFQSNVVNWGVLLVPAGLGFRAMQIATRKGDTTPRDREASFANFWVAHNKRFGIVLICFAFFLPLLATFDSYIFGADLVDRKMIDVATYVLIYVMLGWGLNIVVGLAGLLDLGYVAFYAVGAYSYALLAVNFGLSFWVCLPLAGILAASFGVALGFPVLRLRGDYLAIVTLGFGEMVRVILINWYWFTGGPKGINKVPRPSFFGLDFEKTPAAGVESFHTFFGIDYSPLQRVIFLYVLILVMALVTNFFTLRIRRLPIGRAWEALREDETACRALGINPTNTKLTAFAIGAMFAGFAGSFSAARQAFIAPESFTFLQSAIILAIVVLGGLGSQIGIVLAAVVLIGIPEYFRDLQDYRMLVFGIGMVLIMIWRPGGLLSHREPTIRLNASKRSS